MPVNHSQMLYAPNQIMLEIQVYISKEKAEGCWWINTANMDSIIGKLHPTDCLMGVDSWK